MSWDEPVSPELALVDPELAARLRASMAVPVIDQPSRPRVELVRPPAHPAEPEPSLPREPARGTAALLAHRATVAIAVLLVLLPFAAFLPPRGAPTLAAEPEAVEPGGARVMRLAWPTDPSATYYVVRLLRGGRVVRTALPGTPTIDLAGPFAPGTYTWRVFAGYGTIDASRTRGPIAEGTIAWPASAVQP